MFVLWPVGRPGPGRVVLGALAGCECLVDAMRTCSYPGYGGGFHFDDVGLLALVPFDSECYAELAGDASLAGDTLIKLVKA